MASCYGGGRTGQCFGLGGEEKLSLPWKWPGTSIKVADGKEEPCNVVLDFFRSHDEREQGRELMNAEISAGLSWPFDAKFESQEAFSQYFLSHSAFLLRVTNFDDRSEEFRAAVPHGVLACFYIKPNFPGRCDHICNGGFIVREAVRGNRLGRWMGECFLPLARDLGYRASFFNLVFVTNKVSDRLWRELGFTLIGTLPGAAKQNGYGWVDAHQYYYDLTTLPPKSKDSGEASDST